MPLEEIRVAIIGAGVVGLSIAAELGQEGVFVFEKNRSFGLETSSRNSEVVHAGIYYLGGSLKAQLCIEGRNLLYEFCERHGVRYRKCGKVIIAVSEDEIAKLEILYERAKGNGVQDVSLISRREIKKLEPNVKGIAGLYSPSTGILDTYSFMKALYNKAKGSGVAFVFDCEIVGIEKANLKYIVYIREGKKTSSFTATALINSAGLNAKRVAQLAGIDTIQAGYETCLLKGDYFSISAKKWGLVKRLIYPVPGIIGVGIHNCIAIDGRERLGPSEYYVDDIDYRVNEDDRGRFYNFSKRFFPFLEPDDLEPESSGIRPVLQGPGGTAFKDFIVVHEGKRGFPGLINLIGIESPGFTSSIAIGRYVRELTKEILG